MMNMTISFKKLSYCQRAIRARREDGEACRPRSCLDHENSPKYVSENSRFFFSISRKCSKYLKNIWLHFKNITVTQKNSRLSKMAKQISAILLNISHMAHVIMENIAESDYNRPICGDLFEFLSLKCPCPNEH